MEQGTFSKCENCNTKPATVRLYKEKTPFEKKLCYNCEQELSSTDQYKYWQIQHLPYSSLKAATLDASSKSFGVSSIDSAVRSQMLTSLRGQAAKLTTSHSSHWKSTISQLDKRPKEVEALHSLTTASDVEDRPSKLGASFINFEASAQGPGLTEKDLEYKNLTSEALLRPRNRAQPESLGIPDYRSPVSRNLIERPSGSFYQFEAKQVASKRALIREESKPLMRNPQSLSFQHGVDKSRVDQDYIRATFNPNSESNRNMALETNNYDYIGHEKELPNRRIVHKTQASVGNNDDSLLTGLNYSGRKTATGEKRNYRQELANSGSRRRVETDYGVSTRERSKENDEIKRKFESIYRNFEHKYQQEVDALESEIRKAELDGEKIITELRKDIAQVKEERERHRDAVELKELAESSKLTNILEELEKNYMEEEERKANVEKKLEENRVYFEKQMSILSKELDLLRLTGRKEKDEIEQNIKTQKDRNLDLVRSTKEDHENFVTKMKRDNKTLMNELNLKLDKVNTDISKSQREKEDIINQLQIQLMLINEKAENEDYRADELRDILAEKNDRLEKLRKRLGDSEQEISLNRSEIEFLVKEQTRLRSENEKLVTKLAKLNKISYGSSAGK